MLIFLMMENLIKSLCCSRTSAMSISFDLSSSLVMYNFLSPHSLNSYGNSLSFRLDFSYSIYLLTPLILCYLISSTTKRMSGKPPLSVQVEQLLALIKDKKEELQKFCDDLVVLEQFPHDREVQNQIKAHISEATKRIKVAPKANLTTSQASNNKPRD